MAGFSSYQDSNNMNSFLVHDSVYMKIMSGFMEDEINMAMNTNSFSQIYPQTEPDLQETTPCPVVPEIISSCLDHNSEMGLISHEDNEPSVTRKQSSESSTVVDKLESGDQQVTQKLSSIAKKRKTRNGSGSSPNSAQSKEYGREEKGKKKQKQCNGEANKEKKKQIAKADKKDQKKAAAVATTKQQEPPSGYIHVRARRGQATDSHSLAERVRREKISERMQILQRLVPGCDKVTGKALVLDEIINYVQSLQNQVEFLSMKLASVDPMLYDFSLEQDSFMHFTPQERLNSMHASPLQQCNPNQPTGFADTPTPPTNIRPNTFNNPLDISAFSQDNASLLWDEEEQGDKFLNPSGFSDNY